MSKATNGEAVIESNFYIQLQVKLTDKSFQNFFNFVIFCMADKSDVDVKQFTISSMKPSRRI